MRWWQFYKDRAWDRSVEVSAQDDAVQLGLPGDGDRGGALPRRLSPPPLPQCNLPWTHAFNITFEFQSVFAKHFDDILPRLSSVYAWHFQSISISFSDLREDFGNDPAFVFTFPQYLISILKRISCVVAWKNSRISLAMARHKKYSKGGIHFVWTFM